MLNSRSLSRSCPSARPETSLKCNTFESGSPPTTPNTAKNHTSAQLRASHKSGRIEFIYAPKKIILLPTIPSRFRSKRLHFQKLLPKIATFWSFSISTIGTKFVVRGLFRDPRHRINWNEQIVSSLLWSRNDPKYPEYLVAHKRPRLNWAAD